MIMSDQELEHKLKVLIGAQGLRNGDFLQKLIYTIESGGSKSCDMCPHLDKLGFKGGMLPLMESSPDKITYAKSVVEKTNVQFMALGRFAAEICEVDFEKLTMKDLTDKLAENA